MHLQAAGSIDENETVFEIDLEQGYVQVKLTTHVRDVKKQSYQNRSI